MRTDLGMRKGKMIAQGAHASLAVILGMTYDYDPSMDMDNYHPHVSMGDLRSYMEKRLTIRRDTPLDKWINGRFTKICVRVDSEEELLEINKQAEESELPVALIKDAGLTEFKEPTLTCLAIGPANAEEIDKLTGHLKLL